MFDLARKTPPRRPLMIRLRSVAPVGPRYVKNILSKLAGGPQLTGMKGLFVCGLR